MSWPVRIKNCGMKTADAIDASIRSGVDYLGFIIHPASPRHISPAAAATLAQSLPTTIRTVAVMVDPDNNAIDSLLAHWRPDILQLHGDETPRRVSLIRSNITLPIIKAIAVADASDIERAKDYAMSADYLLFDTKHPELHGGSGLTFDWNLFKGASLPLPWFLSGGLHVENIADALRITGARMVDVSSGIEAARGLKDISKIQIFNETVKKTVI